MFVPVGVQHALIRPFILLISLLCLYAPAHGKDRLLRDTPWIAFDLETTGLSAATDRVVEIGAVRILNGRVAGRRNWLVNPGRPIPERATAVHGITDADVAGAAAFPVAYAEFRGFVSNAVLVAHNARFDVRFLEQETSRANLPVPTNAVLDSLALARRWFPELERHNLKALATHFEVRPKRYHRARHDAETLAAVLLKAFAERPPLMLDALTEAAGGALHFKRALTLDRAGAQAAR